MHNFGVDNINLEGYFITDDIDNPTKWRFPNVNISSDDYLVLWASDKDRDFIISWRGVITEGNTFNYLIPTSPVDPDWTSVGFDDSSWETGASGFGYADGDDNTNIPNGTNSVYIRRKFTIDDVASVNAALLDMDYDDGYVAYINGVEISRANINGNPPNYLATTIEDREATLYNGGSPERTFLNNIQDFLREGENVLSIQGHNISSNSSDFTLIPFLTIGFNGNSNLGFEPDDVLALNNNMLHTNFKLSSSGENIFLYNQDTVLLSTLELPGLSSNISFGLNEATGEQVFFQTPTPGSRNNGNGFMGQSMGEIEFSHQGGQTDPLELSMSTDGDRTIRYTLDSSEPNSQSAEYTSPLALNQTTIVRAKIFEDGLIPSQTQTRSYLINTNHSIPIISLVTEPDNFFGEENGIYVFGTDYESDFPHFGANYWQDWERRVNFSLYDDEVDGNHLSLNAGIKIFGGWSRGNDQRSLSIFARKQYGTEEIDYPIFPNLPYQEFQALVLRNSGNDWLNSNIRDGVLTSLMDGSGIEIQGYRPAATYINGEYWGIYNIREKINEHFIASKFDIDPDSIKVLELEGFEDEYQAFVDFIEDNDLTDQANYDFVSSQMDIENFIMYQVAQIFVNNTDWPGNNIKFWKSPETKWRWILFDTDFGFGIWNNFDYFFNTVEFALEPNGNTWPNPPWSTLLFRKLIANEKFEIQFVNRFADELNTRFLPNNVRTHIDSIAALSGTEVQRHYNRWGGDINNHFGATNRMKTYADVRPGEVKNHLLQTLNLPQFHTLTTQIDDTTSGYIQLNSLRLTQDEWEGDYFENIPINIEAIAREGYEFSHWSGSIDSEETEQVINMQSAMTLRANFKTTVSTQDISMVEAFDVFPNPSDGRLTIHIENNQTQSLNISIFDQSGRLISVLANEKISPGNLDYNFQLDHLPKGTYLIQLKNEEENRITKEWIKLK